jgi:hypothetical protein
MAGDFLERVIDIVLKIRPMARFTLNESTLANVYKRPNEIFMEDLRRPKVSKV